MFFLNMYGKYKVFFLIKKNFLWDFFWAGWGRGEMHNSIVVFDILTSITYKNTCMGHNVFRLCFDHYINS